MASTETPPMAPLHPEMVEFMKSGFKPPSFGPDTDFTAIRTMMLTRRRAAIQAQDEASPPADINLEDLTAPARDDHAIPVRTYRPKTPPATGSPLIVVLHGGGFHFGGVENDEATCRWLVRNLGATVASIAYRQAPEYRFPHAPYDAYDAFMWIAKNAESWGANPRKGFIIGGSSAGANLAFSVAHLAVDERISPPVTGVMLSAPILGKKELFPAKYQAQHVSMKENEFAPGLNAAIGAMLESNYNNTAEVESPLFMPVLWPSGHADLPPMYFQTSELDPYRDDSIVMEKMLREDHGIKTKIDFYKGLPHGFWSIAPDMEVSKKAQQDQWDGYRWLLEQHA